MEMNNDLHNIFCSWGSKLEELAEYFQDKYNFDIDDEDLKAAKETIMEMANDVPALVSLALYNNLFYATPKPLNSKLKKDKTFQESERLPDVTFNDKYQLYAKETAGKMLEVYFKTYDSALVFKNRCICAAFRNSSEYDGDNVVDEQIILYEAGYGRPNQPKPFGRYIYDIDEFNNVKILNTRNTKYGPYKLRFFCNELRDNEQRTAPKKVEKVIITNGKIKNTEQISIVLNDKETAERILHRLHDASYEYGGFDIYDIEQIVKNVTDDPDFHIEADYALFTRKETYDIYMINRGNEYEIIFPPQGMAITLGYRKED